MKKILFYLLIGSSFIAQSCINNNEDPVAVPPSQGKIVEPSIGGDKEPNQVWIDLSDVNDDGIPKQTVNVRTDWDLAFYSGNDGFKVILNSSITMAAAKIPNATDIAAVKDADLTALKAKVKVGNYNPANSIYVDDVTGNFPSGYTAIEGIAANDSENGVYLVNMGKELYVGNVALGSVSTGGADRGWMKLQVVRSGEGYKIKYGGLNDTTLETATISKKSNYNYTFYSLKEGKEVNIQPEKNKWDISFSVFTNLIEGAGSYSYADFVLTNNIGNVGAYEVKVASGSTIEAFNNFEKADVVDSKLVYNDQRLIGGGWREVGPSGYQVIGNVFYVIKDAEGTYYKLRFTRLTSSEGVRGHSSFQYKALK